MKKLFSVLAIAALVSCNSGDDKKTDEVKADTTVAATVDTMAKAAVDTMAKAAVDTTAKK